MSFYIKLYVILASANGYLHKASVVPRWLFSFREKKRGISEEIDDDNNDEASHPMKFSTTKHFIR